MNKKALLTMVLLMIFSSIFSQQKLITPPYLQKGDSIVILAPAGILRPSRKEVVLKAKKMAESWGLNVILSNNIFNQNNHFSGTDIERFQDFQDALDDPSVKAIWSARGGYGSVRILDKLSFAKFKKQPKWIIGYSDITVFHNHIHTLGFETIHGIMPTSLEKKPEQIIESISSFKKSIFGEALSYTIPSSKYNRIHSLKVIEGQVIGGNIAILASMLGSDSQLETEGKILFIEEIGEYKYSIDRMLQSLKRAGYFRNVHAVIVGNMSSIKKNSTKWGSSIEQLILDVIPENIPVLFDFPAGHEADNRALIFGRKIQLISNENDFTVVFKD